MLPYWLVMDIENLLWWEGAYFANKQPTDKTTFHYFDLGTTSFKSGMCIFIHQVRLLKKWRPLKKLTHFWHYAVYKSWTVGKTGRF
jgi:hypothetical protein